MFVSNVNISQCPGVPPCKQATPAMRVLSQVLPWQLRLVGRIDISASGNSDLLSPSYSVNTINLFRASTDFLFGFSSPRFVFRPPSGDNIRVTAKCSGGGCHVTRRRFPLPPVFDSHSTSRMPARPRARISGFSLIPSRCLHLRSVIVAFHGQSAVLFLWTGARSAAALRPAAHS